MKTIKFRAWNTKAKIMSVEVDLYHGLEEWERGQTEIMQYTGLKDYKGIEIYEGDIIKHLPTNDIVAVEWDEASCSWSTSNCQDWVHISSCHIVSPPGCKNPRPEELHNDDLRVIGNIYEHSHLLATLG